MYLQFNSSLQLLQISTRSNSLVSALNTNTNIRLYNNGYGSIFMEVLPTRYFDVNVPEYTSEVFNCYTVNSIAPAGAYTALYSVNTFCQHVWPECPLPLYYFAPNASAMIDGFFGGCTPLNALLETTFDCLHNINCLKQFRDYFPNVNRVFVTRSFIFHKKK